ncbi:MAG: hypothetical protein A2Y82_04210 [Candidatus Buchananbacteria bacterium RBG_13_36_9]|uniref:Uncharacterized protein n=1 Tax=Candidatus Buchananbacteria bacterium RBG_13_36_9 TaxID=1797530 RepID=A0A1G1XT99_9BACT|nr:MAG: hypothetical protein A2Y82_04210 [Candidatus Buchananbacteria bacterium RBG_13_36_9]
MILIPVFLPGAVQMIVRRERSAVIAQRKGGLVVKLAMGIVVWKKSLQLVQVAVIVQTELA